MLVYVVRHGQSESNRDNYFPGKVGVHLTERGIDEARRAGMILSSISFTHIYSSDYARALETAQNAIPGCEPIIDKRLRECDYGYLSGVGIAFIKEHFGEAFLENQRRRDYRVYGGESTAQQIDRVRPFVRDLEELDENSTVAVFCHEGTVKSILATVLDEYINFRRIKCDNGSISVFEYKDGKWTLDKWNMTSG